MYNFSPEIFQSNEINPTQNYQKNDDKMAETATKTLKTLFLSSVLEDWDWTLLMLI